MDQALSLFFDLLNLTLPIPYSFCDKCTPPPPIFPSSYLPRVILFLFCVIRFLILPFSRPGRRFLFFWRIGTGTTPLPPFVCFLSRDRRCTKLKFWICTGLPSLGAPELAIPSHGPNLDPSSPRELKVDLLSPTECLIVVP